MLTAVGGSMAVSSLANGRHLLALAAACGFVLVPLIAGAQPGVVSGTVTDTTGAPVFGAEVGIPGVAYRSVTDERGVFHLGGVPVGAAQLSVRRMGFAPYTISVSLSDANLR